MKQKILAAMMILAVSTTFTGCAVIKKQQTQETATTETEQVATAEQPVTATEGMTEVAFDQGAYVYSDDSIKLGQYKGITYVPFC